MAATWRALRRHAHRAVLRHLRSSDGAPFSLNGSTHPRQQPLLSGVYNRIVSAKRSRDVAVAQRISPPQIPVLSVGNFTFGATGKTPCVMFLADFILKEAAAESAQDHETPSRVPMLLTRGYGDDEWRMFASRFPTCKVVVGSDRLSLGRDAVAQFGRQLSCVLLEDGLQQWKIKKDLEIVMVDTLAPFGNGKLIPCGSLRELPVDALARADVVLLHHANLVQDRKRLDEIIAVVSSYTDSKREVVIGTSEMAVVALPSVSEYESSQITDEETTVSATADWGALQDKTALIFCGVGNPESVELVVSAMGCWSHVAIESFPDHYAFTEADLLDVKTRADAMVGSTQSKRSDVAILTTEKDYGRSAKLIQSVFEGYDVRIIVGGFNLVSGKEAVLNRVKNLLL